MPDGKRGGYQNRITFDLVHLGAWRVAGWSRKFFSVTFLFQHEQLQLRRAVLRYSLPGLADGKRLRLLAGLSTRDAGRAAGVAHTTIQKWERAEPAAINLEQAAAFYGWL